MGLLMTIKWLKGNTVSQVCPSSLHGNRLLYLFLSSFKQPLTDEIYLYYLVEVGFYLSLKISLFVDVKRKVCMRISTCAALNKATRISPVVFMPTTNHSVTVDTRGRCLKIEIALSSHFQLETNGETKCKHTWKTQRPCFPYVYSTLSLVSMYNEHVNVFLCLLFVLCFFYVQDFWQMVIHHIVTTILLVLSYNTGFFRIGCVIILLHDVSDVFLEVSCDSVLNSKFSIYAS